MVAEGSGRGRGRMAVVEGQGCRVSIIGMMAYPESTKPLQLACAP
jgi:hypothetical protein